MNEEIEKLRTEIEDLKTRLSKAHSERNRVVSLMANFAANHYADSGAGFTYGTRKEPDGRKFFYMDTPVGQLSWLLEPGDEELFAEFKIPYGKPFDGHTSAQKATRINLLRAGLSADGVPE